MSRSDRVCVSTVVAVDPETAFAVFTEEIDAWWRRDPRFRAPEDHRIVFEPGQDGRLVAFRDSGEVFEVGRVRAWEPGRRLVFEWRARQFRDDELTEVEVRFEPIETGTRVSLAHRGWDAIRRDHPVRHGMGDEPAFRALYGSWWADLLLALRDHLALRQGLRGASGGSGSGRRGAARAAARRDAMTRRHQDPTTRGVTR